MDPVLSMVFNSESLQKQILTVKTKESRLIEEALLTKKEIKDGYLKAIELDGISKKLSKYDDLYKVLLTDDNHLDLSSKDIRPTWFKEIKDALSKCKHNDFFLVIDTSCSPLSPHYDEYMTMLYAFAKELPCKDMLVKKDSKLYHYNMDNAKMNNDKVIRFGRLSTEHEYIPFVYHLDKSLYEIGPVPTVYNLIEALMDGTGFSYDV